MQVSSNKLNVSAQPKQVPRFSRLHKAQSFSQETQDKFVVLFVK